MTKKYVLESVFTPATSASLTYVERPELHRQITKGLVMPGTQLVVYGTSGSGKTTIIQSILNEKAINFITTNCMLSTTVNEIILDAFDKLNPYYIAEKSSKKGVKIAPEFKKSYLGIDTILKTELTIEDSDKKVRPLPLQLTPQRLAEFMGVANIVWVLEDFHKVQVEEKQKLSQIFKIFVDVSNKYKQVKVIAIGAVGTAREVVNYDTELTNRVSEIHVPLMSIDELRTIIHKGEALLNIAYHPTVENSIVRLCNGLPTICHHLCYSICYSCNVKKTTSRKIEFGTNTLIPAMDEYLREKSDSYKSIVDKALKINDNTKCGNMRPILEALCKSDREELNHEEIINYRNNRKIYQNNIKDCLSLLTSVEFDKILRYDENSGKYSFTDPFIKAYTRMFIERNKSKTEKSFWDIIGEIFN